MTSEAGAGNRSSSGVRWERPSWLHVAAIAALLLFAFFVVRPCQEDDVRVSKDQAIATAEAEVDFEPEEVQARFLRQEVDRSPFWFISLARIEGEGDDERFTDIAVVRIDANTGQVTEVQERNPRQGANPKP